MGLWCNLVGRFYLPVCIESEEIQCPDIKLSTVQPFSFHMTVFCGECFRNLAKVGANFSVPVAYCAILRVHVGLESSDVISGSRHDAVSVVWLTLKL